MKRKQLYVIVTILILTGIMLFLPFRMNNCIRETKIENEPSLKSSETDDYLCWGVDVIDAERVWGGVEDATDVIRDEFGNPIKPAGQGVNVLIIDSGIKEGHEDLDDNYIDGFDYTDWYTFPDDINGHGTKCAGIIAMEDNGKGSLGVAPEVNLYVAKVHNWPEDLTSGINTFAAIETAIATHDDTDENNDVDIISLSLVSENPSFFHTLLTLAVAKGIVIIAGVGNENTDEIRFFSSHPDVFAVGAVEKKYNEQLEWTGKVERWVDEDGYGSNYGEGEYEYLFTTYGSHIDIVAPGRNILTTGINSENPYVRIRGTSAATPHVAGVAALIISQDLLLDGQRDLSVSDVYTILRNTANIELIDDYDDYSKEQAYDYYGYGLVNAYGACDTEKPTVSIIAPGSSVRTYSGHITCKATASDNYRIDKVQFKINNGDWNDAQYSESSDLWKWDWAVSSEGQYTVHCRAYDARGNYRDTSKIVSVTLGGGEGCPILSVYDGEDFIEEGLLDIHNPDGIDEIYEHTLINQPLAINNSYYLRLTEHFKTISHIDKVELWGKLANEQMIKLPLLSALHNELGQVKYKLWLSDDKKAITKGADHNNGVSQFIDLQFLAPQKLEFIQFLFVIEGNNHFIK